VRPWVIRNSQLMEGTGLMSKLDIVKEEIAFAKFWLGILVVSDISLFGWSVSNAERISLLLIGGCAATLVAMTAGAILLHRQIRHRIRQLKDL
jgi:Alphavirus glycoprotein J